MEPFSRLLTFAWEGSLVAECSLYFGLDHLTSWKRSLPNAMWCLHSWTEILWKNWIDFIIFSLPFFLCFSTDALSPFFLTSVSSHSHSLHLLFSIFLFLFVLSRPLPPRPFFFLCPRACILFLLLLFHTFSLSGGCFGPCDLWPPVSERVSVFGGRGRKRKRGGGVR